MATVTLTTTRICSGGNHFTIELSVDGVVRATKTYEGTDLVDAVSDVDAEDVIPVLIRMHKLGKTNAQVRTALLAGITITV